MPVTNCADKVKQAAREDLEHTNDAFVSAHVGFDKELRQDGGAVDCQREGAALSDSHRLLVDEPRRCNDADRLLHLARRYRRYRRSGHRVVHLHT